MRRQREMTDGDPLPGVLHSIRRRASCEWQLFRVHTHSPLPLKRGFWRRQINVNNYDLFGGVASPHYQHLSMYVLALGYS